MLEWLKNILGEDYTDEVDAKVSAEIGKNFVTKADFNQVNIAKKKARRTPRLSVSDRATPFFFCGKQSQNRRCRREANQRQECSRIPHPPPLWE